MGFMNSTRAYGERMAMNASAWLRSGRGVIDTRRARAIGSDILSRGGIAPWKSTPTMVSGAVAGAAIGAGYSYARTGRVDPRTTLQGAGIGAVGGLGYNLMRGVQGSYRSGMLGPVGREIGQRATRGMQSMGRGGERFNAAHAGRVRQAKWGNNWSSATRTPQRDNIIRNPFGD